MPAFVLDASAALPWCFRDETTTALEELLDRATSGEEVLVPAHWPMEVLNGLVQAVKRGRVTQNDVDIFLLDIAAFRIEVDVRGVSEHMAAVRVLAEKHRLTTYDAAYLELAKRLNAPLATLDGALIRAANAEGVSLVE